MSKLVHVISIGIADIKSLESAIIVYGNTVHFKTRPLYEEIPVQDLVGVKIEDNYENNQKIYTTTATFLSHGSEPMDGRQACFLLRSVSGQSFLIGTHERPYPIIKETDNFPEKPADSSLKRVTVTWKAPCPMLRII